MSKFASGYEGKNYIYYGRHGRHWKTRQQPIWPAGFGMPAF